MSATGNAYLGENLSGIAETFLLCSEKHTLPQKSHSHYYCELLYVLKGTASVTYKGEKNILTKGGVFFIHAGAVHSITSGLGTQVVSVCFDQSRYRTVDIAFQDLPEMLERAEKSLCTQTCFKCGELPEQIMEMCFCHCVKEGQLNGYGSDIAMSACIGLMIVEIIRVWKKNGFNVVSDRDNSEGLDISGVSAYIAQHCDEPLRVEELAEKCQMSYSYFAKCFREKYGQSCKEYIEKVRVDKAKKLLLFTNHDLSFISQELCFSDCSHLIKVFKKQTGLTPKQFREIKGSANQHNKL